MHSVIFLFHIALIFSIMYIFYLILDKLSFSVLFSVAPQIFHSQPTSPSQWEMLTGCDVSVTRPEVERLRFANTHIYTLTITPSHHLTISPSHHLTITPSHHQIMRPSEQTASFIYLDIDNDAVRLKPVLCWVCSEGFLYEGS